FGEGGGEAFQLRFEGEGVVYVQPSERATFGGDL
ncbi:AIM24 family protein, partial [Streptomyces sp. McG6]|nr:AIM24 family protein [Streptomyces sp. McG6]